MMIVQHVAAFSNGTRGGNPAGVVLCENTPETAVMQKVAAEVGYSETVFASPVGDGWRVRYFSPEIEVDFCGHATIALGAALAKHEGAGTFNLVLNRAVITVEGNRSGDDWRASFQSPPTRSAPVRDAVLDEAMALFGLGRDQLDARIPPAIAHGGGDHLVLALREHQTLRSMQYDFEQGRALATRQGFVTYILVYSEQPQVFHARNPFPSGGVYEDPATGSAAAALAGYLRDIDWPHRGEITIHQGEDMGMHSLLCANITPESGASIRVSGTVRFLLEH